jgi:hypothetical protein
VKKSADASTLLLAACHMKNNLRPPCAGSSRVAVQCRKQAMHRLFLCCKHFNEQTTRNHTNTTMCPPLAGSSWVAPQCWKQAMHSGNSAVNATELKWL